MRVCILGLPGHVMTSVIDYCRLALGIPLREAILNDAGAIQRFLETGNADIDLVASNFPNRSLVSWIARHHMSTIVVAPDIYVCIAQSDKAAQESHGLLPGAISHSLSGLAMARDIPGRVHITGLDIQAELADLRSLFGSSVGRCNEQSLIEAERRIASSFSNCVVAGQAADLGGVVSNALFADMTNTCQGILDFVRYGSPCELEWPVTLFADCASRARPALPQIDLTGPARYLYWGPYLYLPPGEWELRASIEIARKPSPIEVRLDIWSETWCHSCKVLFLSNGRYEVCTQFIKDEALEALEVRLFIDRGEIEGELGFGGVRLRQLVPSSYAGGVA